MAQLTKICILGGGFGGLYTALYLAKSKEVINQQWQITLVEPKDNFLFTPLLYEILTDELQRWEIAPTYQKLLLGSKINWIQDYVKSVNFERKEVILTKHSLLNYDYLVLAVGRKNKFAPIAGLQDYALTFRSIIDVELLKNRLQLLKADRETIPKIAIVGAGANGMELACKINDYFVTNKSQTLSQIYVIDRSEAIVKNFNSGIQKATHKAIKKRNIQLLLSSQVVEIASNYLAIKNLDHTQQYPIDLVIWTAGTTCHDWISNLACPQNSQAQLLTLPTLQLIDYPEVLALGDVADIQNYRKTSVPTTAQAAYQQATIAAKNLRAMINGKSLKKFSYLHLGDMLTLGKGEAIISSFGLNFTGKLAGLIRRLIYIQRLPTMSHKWQVIKHLFFRK